MLFSRIWVEPQEIWVQHGSPTDLRPTTSLTEPVLCRWKFLLRTFRKTDFELLSGSIRCRASASLFCTCPIPHIAWDWRRNTPWMHVWCCLLFTQTAWLIFSLELSPAFYHLLPGVITSNIKTYKIKWQEHCLPIPLVLLKFTWIQSEPQQ